MFHIQIFRCLKYEVLRHSERWAVRHKTFFENY